MNRNNIHSFDSYFYRAIQIIVSGLILFLSFSQIHPFLNRIESQTSFSITTLKIIYGIMLLLLADISGKLSEGSKYSAFLQILTLASIFIIFSIIFDISAKTILRRDDYWEIYEAQTLGFPKYFMYIFTEKSGRYSAFLIKMIYALVPPLYWIRFTIFAAGILFFYCCVRISEKMTPTGNKSLPLSITLFTGIYLIQTKIWESFFWGGGGQIYSWGILCAFASWIALFDSLRTPSKLIRITALSLAFLSCGFAELINIAMIFIAISFVVFSFSHQAEYSQYQRKQIMHFLIVLIISSIIAFAMPGNYANATRFVEGGSISGTFSEITLILIRAIKDAFLTVYAHTTVQSVQFLLLGGICFLLGAEPKVAISDAKKEFLQALGILILLVLSSIASVTLNGILQFTPTRIGSVPLSIIWIGYSYFLFKLGTFIGSLARHESIRTQAVFPGLIIGICLWLSFYFDAQPQLYRIYHAWNQRDSELRQIAAEGNFDGEELETCAIEINGTTLTDFPYDSYGFLIGRYYGLPTLYADDKCNY